MSNLYFVRHGQAGTRDAYDSLSELGRRQSRLLGEYFVAQGIEFAAAYAGAMMRQRETAEEVRDAYARRGLGFPEIMVEPGWNEFDYHDIYREIAPLICEEDEEFRREYETVREEMNAGGHLAQVHRQWRPSDTKVVEAWVGGRYPYAGETWEQFAARVVACRLAENDVHQSQNIIVFTSATPTALWTGRALDLSHHKVRQLAGVLHNTALTILRRRGEDLLLLAFNSVPHLSAPGIRTRR